MTTIVTPDRKLETGRTRQGEPPGTDDRRKGPAGGGTFPDAEVRATLPPAERPRQGKYPGFFRILREGGDIQGNPAPRARLEKEGIRDGEVVKERFVGPLARLLRGQGIRRIGRRAELGRCGGEALEKYRTGISA